jgi:crotonobetainyl-CoA:carnitine CoA-transferase CaiB-like acyl-CoA transferase
MRGFGGTRVIDLSRGIAGAYATKLFADAGADVIKVEPAAGDPLRNWSATGADLTGEDGALFQFLHLGKRSVVPGPNQLETLIAGADLIVDSSVPPALDLAGLRERHPSLVVLSITPFGLTGPYATRPATDFTLQAESGALAVRGLRAWPPYQAGGRIVEWVSGTFAAVAAGAALRRSTGGGKGEFIDFSMLELANFTSNLYVDLVYSLLGRPPIEQLGPPRSIETPSIEPTLDGYVGFCTNSRQQFDDFLILIERPDLLGDDQLARPQGRTARFEEWTGIVRSWTSRHTTAEIIKYASELRIPVAPVCSGASVGEIEHFNVRRVFGPDPRGRFRLPRRPWRLNDQDPPPARAAPRLDEHAGQGWLPGDAGEGGPPSPDGPLPLEGLRVLDITAWWAGPSATNLLAGLGADVVHVEAIQRLDGMRMAGAILGGQPHWWEYSSIFLAANTNKRGLTLDLTSPRGLEVAKRLTAVCDAVVENFTPRVMANFGLDWPTIQEINPRAIFVRMPAFGLSGPWRDNTGFAQTMEQISGLAWVTGHPHDQPRIQRGPSDPNAGMHAAFALLVALAERDATGRGQHLEVTMVEAALNTSAEQVIEYSAYGNLLQREGNRSPHAAPQNLYACRGAEQWLAISIATDDQWDGLKWALGRPGWADQPGLESLAGRRAAHEQLDRELSAWAAEQRLDQAVELLLDHGVPSAPAVDPRLTPLHPQLRARGYYEELDHPVVGTHSIPGPPFRFSGADHWLRRPAPTVGQHSREILEEWLGMSSEEIDVLEDENVIGTQPKL